jgi:hypothetical protein
MDDRTWTWSREDGRKKMRERLVRLTGGEKQSPDPPLQTCTPAAIQSQARAVNRSGASGMKQFVESSSIHGTLPGLSRGGSQTEFWFGSPRARWSVDASQAQPQPQPQARNGPPTKITVQYTLCSIGMPMAKALSASPSGTDPSLCARAPG